MQRRTDVAALLVCIFLAPCIAVAVESNPAEDAIIVQALVPQLDSDDFATRERASKTLMSMNKDDNVRKSSHI